MGKLEKISKRAKLFGEMMDARRMLKKIKSFGWVEDNDHQQLNQSIEKLDREIIELRNKMEKRKL